MEWYLCCFPVLHLGPFYFNSFGACANPTSNFVLGVEHIPMSKRHPRRTDEEWLSLIQECRSSGLSDKAWCEEHHIAASNLYYQIRRLRKMACEIPEPTHSSLPGKPEIVQVSFDTPDGCRIQESMPDRKPSSETAIRLMVRGFQIEITNAADGETVFRTLSALQRLC